MSYKTILVHVDESHCTAEKFRIAGALALAEHAHLIGAAMTGLSRLVYKNGIIPDDDPQLASHLNLLREKACRPLPAFESAVRNMGVTSFESIVVDDDAADGLSLLAHYSDLVIAGQTEPGRLLAGARRDFLGHVVLNAGRPVLIVPHAGQFTHVGARVQIAWNGSAEAARAIANAMPILKRAQAVQMIVLDPASLPHAHREDPGASMVQYLGRHGIQVEVVSHDTGLRNVGPVLLRHSIEYQADLLVMGGYGHSRFREVVLGGVTHTVLEKMTVPVLMSH